MLVQTGILPSGRRDAKFGSSRFNRLAKCLAWLDLTQKTKMKILQALVFYTFKRFRRPPAFSSGLV